MVFEETTGVYERIYRFNSKWVRKKEKYANSKWIEECFCLRSNLSNDNIISAKRPGLKTGMENYIFFSLKLGKDLENRAAHPHHEFLGETPRDKR